MRRIPAIGSYFQRHDARTKRKRGKMVNRTLNEPARRLRAVRTPCTPAVRPPARRTSARVDDVRRRAVRAARCERGRRTTPAPADARQRDHGGVRKSAAARRVSSIGAWLESRTAGVPVDKWPPSRMWKASTLSDHESSNLLPVVVDVAWKSADPVVTAAAAYRSDHAAAHRG